MLRIHLAACARDMKTVAELFREYREAVAAEQCFDAFDAEVHNLPGEYAPPGGRLWLATWDDDAVGCVALRPHDVAVAEMKRLYVRPAVQGRGVGQRLVEHLLQAAPAAGYKRVRLDTLPTMVAAQHLYRRLGFSPVERYNNCPGPDTSYFEIEVPVSPTPARS